MRSTEPEVLSALTSAVPPVSESEAQAIAAEHYGIIGRARRVAGEKDDNFALESRSGAYFLKIVHPAEAAGVTDLCTTLLLTLAAVPDLPVQRLVLTTSGEREVLLETADGQVRRALLTTYLGGRLLHSVPTSRGLRESLGRTLARLGQELKRVQHPAGHRALLWDLSQADTVRPLLEDLHGLPDHEWLTDCLDQFDRELCSRLTKLRSQLVYNDLNAYNVLIGEDGVTVVGIIDFGDAVVTQVVNDVAIAMVNQLSDDADPIGPALDLVRGYHAVTPLETHELELLYDLVRLRTATRIIITEWRALRHPENRAYILRNTPRDWTHAKHMHASAAPDITRRLLRTCDLD